MSERKRERERESERERERSYWKEGEKEGGNINVTCWKSRKKGGKEGRL